MRSELQDVVDEAARLLGAPVTLEDRDFELVAFAAHPGPVDAVRHASILRRRSTAAVRAYFEGFGIATACGPVQVPGTGSGRSRVAPRLCLPARARGVTYGYLWALEDGEPVDPERAAAAMRLADRAGGVLAQRARARADVAWLLEDLLSADAEAAARAADELDARGLLARRSPVAVVVVSGAAAPTALWGLPRGVLALPQPDGVTLLVPAGSSPDDVAAVATVAEVAARAREAVRGRVDGTPDRVVAGVGEIVPDPAGARESLRHARVAARVASAGATGTAATGTAATGTAATGTAAAPVEAPPDREVRSWADLGVARLLACSAGTLADAVLEPAVQPLLGAGDPDLVRTARVWLDVACSARRASAALGVHRQTLYARLERVEQLTGLRLVSGEPSGTDRTRLHLALSLAPLLR